MKKLVITAALALVMIPLFSQNAEQLSLILEKKIVDYTDFSYMIVSEIGMDCSPFEAYTYCDRFDSFGFSTPANKAISVRHISRFLMSNYGIKGGLLWTAFQSPRYAYRQLKNDGFWNKGTDPDSVLSGRELVRIINRFFTMYPEARLRSVPTPDASKERRNALLSAKEDRR